MIRLGVCADGRELSYDPTLYEFHIAREVVAYKDVADLDMHAHIHWHAGEQHDWFRRINPADLAACNQRALAAHKGDWYAGMTPEERVQADAARDDSVLAGKIVDADPALVHAVVNALEQQGLVGAPSTAGQMPAVNPLAASNLPKGMEALSQFERAQSADRKMTAAEKRLMNKILKNDDKAKAKREKEAERIGRERAKKRMEEETAAQDQRERPAPPKSKITSDAMNVVAANPEHHRFPDAVTGEQQDPDAASHGYNAEVAATAAAVSAEEQALKEMRERNKRDNEMQAMEAATVPGMSSQVKGKRLGLFASFGKNADGSPKRRE